jgi:hypothetical protein
VSGVDLTNYNHDWICSTFFFYERLSDRWNRIPQVFSKTRIQTCHCLTIYGFREQLSESSFS